jgi:type VI secretion system protein ImpK
MGNQYSNRIINASEHLFRTALNIASGDYQDGDFVQLRDTVLADIEHVDRIMFESRYTSTFIGYAKYALVAYIDEAVMKSDWQYKVKWMSSPLQLEIFGDHVAGKKFFDKLNEIVLLSSDAVELLELYYLCLEMGFEGSYRVEGIEKLQALKINIKDQIDSYREKYSKNLLDPEPISNNIYRTLQSGIPSWVIISVSVMIIVLFYAGFEYSLDSLVSANSNHIEVMLNQFAAPQPASIEGI